MSTRDIYLENGIEPADPMLEKKYGVSKDLCDITSGVVTGVRYKSTHNTSGWYIWDGEYSDADDFFVPLHGEHLVVYRPEVEGLLGLPEGWRFILDLSNNYLDVWFDDEVVGKEHRDPE